MIKLRPALISDIDFLLNLREQTMAGYLLDFGIILGHEEQLSRVMYRFDCAVIVVANGRDIGMMKVRRDEGGWTLLQFQISPGAQGQGIGKALLLDLISEAKQYRVTKMMLSVLKNNPAQELYKKLGFRVLSEDLIEYFMGLELADHSHSSTRSMI